MPFEQITLFYLRKFACVYSRHPGSSAWFLASVLRSVTPFPVDRVDPLDPRTNSQIAHLASSIGRQKMTVLGPESLPSIGE